MMPMCGMVNVVEAWMVTVEVQQCRYSGFGGSGSRLVGGDDAAAAAALGITSESTNSDWRNSQVHGRGSVGEGSWAVTYGDDGRASCSRPSRRASTSSTSVPEGLPVAKSDMDVAEGSTDYL